MILPFALPRRKWEGVAISSTNHMHFNTQKIQIIGAYRNTTTSDGIRNKLTKLHYKHFQMLAMPKWALNRVILLKNV